MNTVMPPAAGSATARRHSSTDSGVSRTSVLILTVATAARAPDADLLRPARRPRRARVRQRGQHAHSGIGADSGGPGGYRRRHERRPLSLRIQRRRLRGLRRRGRVGGSGGSGGDPFGFGGGNIFAELERLLSWQGGPVNWNMARQVAEQNIGDADDAPSMGEQSAVREAGRLADHWLDEVTTLPGTGSEVTAWTPDAVDARDAPGLADPGRPDRRARSSTPWARRSPAACPTSPDMAGLEGQLPPGLDLGQLAAGGGPFMGMLRQIGGLLFGAQVGSALAALAQEVVSPTDVGLPLGGAALLPRNVAAAGEGLEVPDDQLRLYLALRELAHQRLFAHVPWLKSHLLGAVEAYARGISGRPGGDQPGGGQHRPVDAGPDEARPGQPGRGARRGRLPGRELARSRPRPCPGSRRCWR